MTAVTEELLRTIPQDQNMENLPKRTIRCAVCCLHSGGGAELYPVRVNVTEAQYAEGGHFVTAREAADDDGYDAQLPVFDELDGGGNIDKIMALFDWAGDDEIQTVDCEEEPSRSEGDPGSAWHRLPPASNG